VQRTGFGIDPPEVIDAGPFLLRRGTVDDADALATAIAESLEHLAPWMQWASPQTATRAAQAARLSKIGWGPADYDYLMVADGTRVVGGCGLHRRIGPTGLEVGYWVHVAHTGLGYATAAATALTQTALSLPGIERVEIHCDEGNAASSAVARRIGYRLDRIDDHTIDSPAQTGRFMIWVMDASVAVGRSGQLGD
jgi:RimJ/RimL family protein N-acetyltransferase